MKKGDSIVLSPILAKAWALRPFACPVSNTARIASITSGGSTMIFSIGTPLISATRSASADGGFLLGVALESASACMDVGVLVGLGVGVGMDARSAIFMPFGGMNKISPILRIEYSVISGLAASSSSRLIS